MIKLPYGVSDFNTIRKEGYVYLDRTQLIDTLEQASKQLLFLRPRRFGKSLLLSMLEHYYDINKAEEFDSLFKDLAVSQTPTPERNKHLILRWDFSMVSAQGDIEYIKSSLFEHINKSIEDFIQRYQPLLKHTIHIGQDGLGSFQSLLNATRNSGHTLYLLIDEYDNFANEVLMHDQNDKKRYRELLEGEGIVKTLFKVVKGSASNSKIARVFITGVSPLVLSDVTSGYNVATDISLDSRFNALCGVTQEELSPLVDDVLQHVQQQDKRDEVLSMMRRFYNGSRFCLKTDKPLLYNPTLCFYFLRHYQLEGEAPRNMLDGNLAIDAGRIRYIAQLPQGEAVIDQLMDESNPVVVDQLEDQFSTEQQHLIRTDPNFMWSLLYYFGVVTIADIDEMGSVQLKIPNQVVNGLYIKQLQQSAVPEPIQQRAFMALAKQFYKTTNLQPLIDYLETHYLSVFSNRDYVWSNELTLKTAFLTLLYNDTYYMMVSEMPVERRYTDLIMLIRPSMRKYPSFHDFVFEFKALKLKDVSINGDELKQVSADVLRQLPAIDKAFEAAKQQLQAYRKVVEQQTEEPERLQCLAVVAIGFDRVLWETLA